ncbi:unnamed protein product [Pleuronectes platessa]|uniref:Uncharacterized protein n=1 Tax=Pleuronectes platessa TaxID=8262 RepID=A0A9N7UXK7_PLEPL|nr:unnamed protein product [Pleuronectes platessa]
MDNSDEPEDLLDGKIVFQKNKDRTFSKTKQLAHSHPPTAPLQTGRQVDGTRRGRMVLEGFVLFPFPLRYKPCGAWRRLPLVSKPRTCRGAAESRERRLTNEVLSISGDSAEMFGISSDWVRVLSRTQNLFGCVSVCACLGFPLFACGFGMKGPGGLVGEALADVSWPVGTRFSRIRLPSQAGFGATLPLSRSLSCLCSPSPFPSY